MCQEMVRKLPSVQYSICIQQLPVKVSEILSNANAYYTVNSMKRNHYKHLIVLSEYLDKLLTVNYYDTFKFVC